MFKHIFMVLLSCTTLLNAAESCYSVELWSVSEKNFNSDKKNISKNEIETCKLFHIGKYYSLRCGCYEYQNEITTLAQHKKNYKNAYITKTLKSRFKKPKKIQKLNDSKKLLTLQKKKIFTNRYSFNSSKVNLTPHLKNKELSAKNELLTLMHELSKNSKKQINHLKNNSDFVGLSVQGKYDQYMIQNYLNREYTDYEYNLKLKFDIFKNGYYEHKTQTQKQIAQTTANYYQNLINLQKYNYEENMNRLNTLLYKINVLYYDALTLMYEDAIKRNKKLLEHGTQTKYEIDKLVHEKNNFLSLKKVYQEDSKAVIPQSIYELLLRVDDLKLRDLEIIQKLSKDNSSDISMQDARFDFLDTEKIFYKDITLNVYSSLRAIDEVGSFATIGAEVNIPLNFTYSEKKRLSSLQMKGIQIKKKAILKHLNSSIKKLYREFYMYQSLIATDKSHIKNFHLELNDFKTIASYNLPSLKVNFDQKILTLQSTIVNLKYEILLKRVEMLKVILKLSYLSNIYDIKKLIVEK